LKFQSLKNEFETNLKKQRNPKPLSPPSPFSFWSASSFYTLARFSFSFFFFRPAKLTQAAGLSLRSRVAAQVGPARSPAGPTAALLFSFWRWSRTGGAGGHGHPYLRLRVSRALEGRQP
jgi:hypothetical protein